MIGFDLFDKTSEYLERVSEENEALADYYRECNVLPTTGIPADDIRRIIDRIPLTNTIGSGGV